MRTLGSMLSETYNSWLHSVSSCCGNGDEKPRSCKSQPVDIAYFHRRGHVRRHILISKQYPKNQFVPSTNSRPSSRPHPQSRYGRVRTRTGKRWNARGAGRRAGGGGRQSAGAHRGGRRGGYRDRHHAGRRYRVQLTFATSTPTPFNIMSRRHQKGKQGHFRSR